MHPALSIVELLFCIFNDPALSSPNHSAIPGPDDQERYLRRHPLLSLALSCKIFSHVALHVLWQDVEGLGQLLWTMPDDIIKITAEEVMNSDSDSDSNVPPRYRKCLTFKKQPVEQEWEPFDRYGALITTLKSGTSIWSSVIQEISPDVLEALTARYELNGTSLLPNLQSLTCNDGELRYAHILLGPNLRSLSITSRTCYDLEASNLTSFLKLAKFNPSTHLRLLNLRGARTSRVGQQADSLFLEFIINIQRMGNGLETLRTIDDRFEDALEASQETLNLLLANERIREIEVCVERFNLDQVLPPDTSVSRKDLHTLAIRAANGVTGDPSLGTSFFHELLRRLNAPNLASFTFRHCAGYISIQDIRAIFTSLQPNLEPKKAYIKQDVISISPLSYKGMTVIPAHHICTFANSFYLLCQPASSTNPTLRFAYLHTLTLCALADLSDSDINSLTSSMPRLKRFVVDPRRAGRTGQSRTTLIGLWFFAKNCRYIDTVGIWFNAVLEWDKFSAITRRDAPTISDPEERRSALRGARNTNWTSVKIGDSYIDDTDVVTKFFKEVCPRLRNMNSIRKNEDSWEKWKAVQAEILDIPPQWPSEDWDSWNPYQCFGRPTIGFR